MEEPKQNPMKKVSWLIVAIAVLSSVIVHLPKGLIPFLDKSGSGTPAVPVGGPAPAARTDQTSGASTVISPNGVIPAVVAPAPVALNNTAGDPEDVANEIRRIATPGNDTSPLPMEAAVLMMKAEHIGSISGCKPGVLLLDGSGLHFACTGDIGKNVDVPLADIARVDKSGIKDSKGHPDHFKIQNADSDQGERIFNDWLQQARLSNQ
jgi:hypothetical protein